MKERTFNLGDVVLITDTYYEKSFTAHCIKYIKTLNNNGGITNEYVFAVDQCEDNNVSYIVGENRDDNVYYFGKVIGNIMVGKD